MLPSIGKLIRLADCLELGDEVGLGGIHRLRLLCWSGVGRRPVLAPPWLTAAMDGGQIVLIFQQQPVLGLVGVRLGLCFWTG